MRSVSSTERIRRKRYWLGIIGMLGFLEVRLIRILGRLYLSNSLLCWENCFNKGGSQELISCCALVSYSSRNLSAECALCRSKLLLNVHSERARRQWYTSCCRAHSFMLSPFGLRKEYGLTQRLTGDAEEYGLVGRVPEFSRGECLKSALTLYPSV